MALDFRYAIDWNDNGYINWDHTGADEYSQYAQPNLILGANLEQFTLTRATVTDDISDYGGDYIETTDIVSGAEVGDAGSNLGEIEVSPSTTYTMVIWLAKLDTGDNANDLYIRAVETTTSPGVVTTTSSTPRTDTGTSYQRHYVTFTTSATSTRVFLQILTNAGSFVDEVRGRGLMLVAGVTVPSAYNDGSNLLNQLTTGSFADFTLTNGALTSTGFIGVDKVTTTAMPTTSEIGDAGSSLGEIVITPDTVYTVVLWLQKNDSSDGSNNLYIRTVETTSSPGTVATKNGTKRTDAGTSAIQHTVKIKTTSTSTRLYVQILSDAGSWVGEVNCYGLMVIEGTIDTPTEYNDGYIKVLTHRMVKARWNVGYKTSIVSGSVANENRLECELYNLDDYITETKYADVHRVYIEGSDDGGSTWTRLYTGWTRKWMPIFETNNPAKHLQFTAVSSRYYMDGVKARLAMQEGIPSNTIMINLAAEAQLPDGGSVSTTGGSGRPGDTAYNYDYAGQNWTEDVDLLRALADTAWGDNRCVYFGRSDSLSGFTFNVLTTPSTTADFTITNFLRGTADYRYADPWFNRVEMKVSPRKLSTTSDKRLWRLPDDYDIPAGDTVTILARYNDDDKPYQIGARDLSYDNDTFASAFAGTITLTPKSTSCYIEIDNSGGGANTLTDLRLIGQKVKTWDSFYEQMEYDTEITSDGSNTLTINSELPDDVDRAQGFMENWLEVYGQKHHRLWSIVVPGDRGEDSDMLDYTVNDVCAVAYPDASTYKHLVIGEEWVVRNNGQYEKKLYLERLYSSGLTPIKPSP